LVLPTSDLFQDKKYRTDNIHFQKQERLF